MASSPNPPVAATPSATASASIAVVRSAYQAFARRDLRELGQLVTDDVRVQWADVTWSATSGRDQLLDQLAMLINSTAGTAMAEPVELYGVDGLMVVIQRETGGRADGDTDRLVGLVVELRDGLIHGINRLQPLDL